MEKQITLENVILEIPFLDYLTRYVRASSSIAVLLNDYLLDN